MRSMYPSLCGDETPMVRRAAASKIGQLVSEMESNYVQNDFLKLYEVFQLKSSGLMTNDS